MLLDGVTRAALRLTAVVAALQAVNVLAQSNDSSLNHVQSTFVSPSEDLAFGITIPQDSDTDIYFTLAALGGLTWAAVGLGADSMAGNALVLMTYVSQSGNNVTFSPRITNGRSEPVPYPDLKVQALNGTGFFDDVYYFVGRCSNCRTWPGGSIDVKSTSQKCIFATGPGGDLQSDDINAPLRYHNSHGGFTMDLVHATGPAGSPIISNSTSSNSGATPASGYVTGKHDWASIFHAIIMIGTFLGLMPLGMMAIRIGGWVKLHAANQGLALVLVITGAGLGFFISTLYNRTKSFNNPHQIIGILVFIAVIAQFALGFFHHRSYQKSQQATKLRPFHIWLGRLVIVLGILNAFLGFPLAQARGYNLILAGLVIAVVPVVCCVLFWRRWVDKRRARARDEPTGYDPEPWRGQEAPAPPYGGPPPPQYGQPDGLGINLNTLDSNGSTRKEQRSDQRSGRAGARGLGVQQTPTEYV